MDHIDRIFVINLRHRTDRMESFLGECKRMNLPMEKVERYEAIRSEDGCVGCNMSHYGVLCLARERGYKTFWIMEDDFVFTISPEEMEQSLKYFFDRNLDWRVVMPTYNHKMVKTLPMSYDDPVIALTYDAQNAASYIVNGSNRVYLDQLIQCIMDGTIVLSATHQHWIGQNDQIWKQLQSDEKWYIFRKRFGEQMQSYSDLSKRITKND